MQIQYDFCNYKKCFAEVREMIKNKEKFQLVVSTNPITSGYWLEKINLLAPTPSGDFVYRGKKRILDYMERVEKECERRGKGKRNRTQGLIL